MLWAMVGVPPFHSWAKSQRGLFCNAEDSFTRLGNERAFLSHLIRADGELWNSLLHEVHLSPSRSAFGGIDLNVSVALLGSFPFL